MLALPPTYNDQRTAKMKCSCGNVITVNCNMDVNRKYMYMCNICIRYSEDLMYHIFDKPVNFVNGQMMEITYYVVFTGHDGTCRNNNGLLITERSIQSHHFYLSDKFLPFVARDGRVIGGPLNLYRKLDVVCECKKSKKMFFIIDARVKPGYIVMVNHGQPFATRNVTDKVEIKELDGVDLCKQLML